MSTVLSGASFFMTQAQMFQALVVMFRPEFDPTAWQLYLVCVLYLVFGDGLELTMNEDLPCLSCTVSFFFSLSFLWLPPINTPRCGLVMVLPSNILGKISTVFAWLGTLTFFVILIALPIYAKKNRVYNTTHDMFFLRENQTGFKNEGLVFLLTFLAPCWCISGYDSTAHLSEETENAAVVVPRAMWTSCLFIAIVGYVFNVVLAYAAYDIDSILSSPLDQPLAAIMQSAMGDGAFPKLLWICTVLSNFGIVFVMNTSGTRIFWAYARDGALPFSRWLSSIHKTTRTPINATVALSTSFALIGLISLGSTTALQAFFSGSSVTGAAAYLIPVLMRCIYEDNPDYVPGPFTLGRLSRPIRWVAVLWTSFTLPLLAFPTTAHPDASTFNWSVVFYVGMFIIVIPWFYLRARFWFKGPGENH